MPRKRNRGRRPQNRRRRRRPVLTLFILLLIGVGGYFGYAFANPLLPVTLEDGQAAVHFIDVCPIYFIHTY